MAKRALLIGINYVGTGHELHGCINDSNRMKEMLSKRGFTEIKQLLEEDATTLGIRAGLVWLTTNAAPGDVLVLHYSGHGSQLPNDYEDDGYEEILCPIDLDWKKKVITDIELRKTFDKVPNNVNCTVVLDCCHSGTMLNQAESLELKTTRKIARPNKASRYMQPPVRIAKKLKGRTQVRHVTTRDVDQSALLIAGCHADQTSADATINNIPQGAATSALLAAINIKPNLTYRELIMSMVAFMAKYKFDQVPELDGSPALYDCIFAESFKVPVPQVHKSEINSKKKGLASFFSSIVKYIKSIFSK
jgi:hypothetical protein